MLHQKYKDDGLVILCQPSNQFGKQEPLEGSDLLAAIRRDWVHEASDSFQFFERADVVGDDAVPLFLYLQNHENATGFMTNAIKWNFTKFLVDRSGVPQKRYGTKDKPSEKDVVALLAQDPLD